MLPLGMLLWLLWPCLVQAAPPEAFEHVHYALDVTYDAAAHTLQGQVTVTAVWRGAQPLTELYFFLPPNTLHRPDPREPAAFSDLRYPAGFDAASLTVTSLREAAQRPLVFTLQADPLVPVGRVPEHALLHSPLPQPSQPGATVQVHMVFTTRIPHAKNWGHYRSVVALDGLWHPLLVPWRQEGWVFGLQSFVHATYTLRLTAPADQEAVASVPWTSHTQHAQRQTHSGTAGPLYHLGLSLSAQWHSEADLTHEPQLQVLTPRGDAPLSARLRQTLRQVLTFYREQWGLVLHMPRVTVVVHERDLTAPFSAVADHLVFLSRDALRVPDLAHQFPAYLLARTLAKQWWGLQTASNLRTERWIGEGLTTYLAIRWLEATYGKGRTLLAWRGAWLPNLSLWEQTIAIPYRRLVASRLDQSLTMPVEMTPDSLGLRQLYEKKGALIYAMLHDLLGAQGFQQFLQRLTTVGRHLTGEDVRHTAEVVSGRDLAWFFQQWVQERVWLDYAVSGVESTRQAEVQGQPRYQHRVTIRRLGEAVMPLTVRLVASDESIYDTALDGVARTFEVTWQSTAPLRNVQLDPAQQLPDVQPLNNVYHVPYTVRPLIDFPRLDRYLLYPFVTLDNNFIDGYTPRLHAIALYLDEQSAQVSVGYKEAREALSVEAQVLRNRFPLPEMASSVTLSDRQGAQTLALETSLLLTASKQQYLIPAHRFTLAYQVAFLDRLREFNGEPVPADFAPSTGRIHSLKLGYGRDTRVPTPVGAPLTVLAEPLAYGYVVRLEAELAAEALGSNRADFQQLRWEVSDYLRLWNQSWLQVRLFGGWSAGTVPLQRKLSLAGIDAVRGYPYRLAFLGDRMLGGTLSVRLPVLPDVRLDLPGRYLSLRSLHIGPFVDGGWVWERDQRLADVSPRTAAGLRLIAGLGFASLLRFEVVADLAVPLEARFRREESALQVWVRLQSTLGGGMR